MEVGFSPTGEGRLRFWLVTLSLLVIAEASLAQVFDRPADQRPELPPFEPLEPLLEELPSVVLPPMRPSPTEPGAAPLAPRFTARGFEVTGSSVFSKEELREVLEPYLGRELGTNDLVAIRNALTQLYIDAGYVTSGAQIPNQDLQDGMIDIWIIEGSLTSVEITGEQYFRAGRLRDRVTLGITRPLNVNKLESNLQLLQQDPRIRQLHARLGPGERPGESVLIVSVEETRPYSISLEMDNYVPPSFGSYRGEVSVTHRNLLGFGDELRGSFAMSEGLKRFEGHYEFPLNARGTLLRARSTYSESEIVEEPFDALEIETEYQAYSIAIEHPLIRSPTTELMAGLLFEWRRADTCFNVLEDLIGCDPFSFIGAGAVDGRISVSVLRFSQEWRHRERNQIFAARSTLSVGLPILGARSHGVDPDGKFVAWLGQFQWARRYARNIQTIFRTDVQLTNDSVPTLEQFPVGGHASVRGYRENQLVRDQGVVASLELRLPVWRAEGRSILELAPFADFGYSTNRSRSTVNPDVLASVGIGLRVSPVSNVVGELYWGHQLNQGPSSGDIQDDGIHFRLRWDAF